MFMKKLKFLLVFQTAFISIMYGQNWDQLGSSINGSDGYDDLGTSVSLSHDGSAIAIGAPEEGIVVGNEGYARVYQLVDGEWYQKGRILREKQLMKNRLVV